MGDANIKERIDRGFGNLALIQQWGGLTSHHLVAFTSDHCPLLIENDPPDYEREGRRCRRFLFEEMWTSHEECGKVIEDAWNRGRNDAAVLKIQRVSADLRVWDKERFGHVRRSIISLREELAAIQRLPVSDQLFHRRKEVEEKLDVILKREEVMWRQRSRMLWLESGDRNNRFFHQHARHRNKINRISGILGEDNKWYSGRAAVGGIFTSYFRNLFTSGVGLWMKVFLRLCLVEFRII